MSDLVGVASNAVASYQRALGTVSNNIANVATDGYSRQEAVLQANPVAKVGTVYLGTGVSVDTVKRQYDSFAEANLRNSNSELASQEPMVNYANRVIDIMGSTSMGLSSAFDQFFNSARDLSSDPASTVLRGSFLRDAENIAARFSELSSQLDLVQNETDDAVTGYVDSMNTIIKQLAQVNIQLTKQKSVSLQPADLLDQRDVLLNDLSNYAHINTFFNENGSVSVSLGPSLSRDVVVKGVTSFILGPNFNSAAPEKVSLVIDPYGDPQPLTGLSGGKLSGLMSFREQVLGSSRSSLDTLATKFVEEVNAIHKGGIDAYGTPGGALFSMDTKGVGSAGTLKLAVSDSLRIAASAQFRVIEAANNTGDVDASILYTPPMASSLRSITSILANNPSDASAISVKATVSKPFTAVGAIPNGLQNISIFLGEADTGQQLQVFSSDGRHLIGSSITDDMKEKLFTEENGFSVDSRSYSGSYLNVNGENSYKDLKVFYGAKADIGQQLQWDLTETDPTKHAALESTPIPANLSSGNIQPGLTSLAGNLFKLNGQALGRLDNTNESTVPLSGTTIQANDIANWINFHNVDGITATAKNEIRISAKQINLSFPLSFTETGVENPNTTLIVDGTSTLISSAHLVTAINDQKHITHVSASLNEMGDIILTNTPGHEGNDIAISSTSGPNALGMNAKTYGGQITMSRPLIEGKDTPIELGFGSGAPTDMAKIGFRTGAYLKGVANEDLLVFVTGSGEAKISAAYAGMPTDSKQALRNQSLQVRFDSPEHFTITDLATGTKVAERFFNPAQLEPAFAYQGIQISFSNPPKTGDVFTIDGNKDGTGNNDNMLLLIDLESKSVMGGGKTFAASYIDQVNDMGNIALQASIAKSALTVVHDQAVAARDQVSGVSLDQEAADLIRYQQAYQASAKILQIASQLFDSILQVR